MFAFAVFLLSLILTSAGDAPTALLDPRSATVEQYVKIRWPRNGHLASSGRFYYIDIADGINQLFRRRPGEPEGTAITRFEDGIGSYRVSEDAKWIAITAGHGGDEQYDIHLLNAETEELKLILTEPNTVFESVVWRRDSLEFAYRANTRSKADFYIHVYDVKTGTSREVWSEPGSWSPVDYDKSGTSLLLQKTVSVSESYVWELSLFGMGSRPLTALNKKWSYGPVGYVGDNDKVVTISNYRNDRRVLYEITVESGELHRVLPQFGEYDLDFAVFNEARTVLAVGANVDGYGQLHLFSMPDYKPLPGPKIPECVLGNVAFQGDSLLYSVNNANTPGVIYRWEVNAPEKPPTALTQAQTQNIDISKFALPQLIRYKSFDGLQVPAFLYLPLGYETGRKVPFVVSYHGGPEAQYRPTFSNSFQYFLSRGYGVLAPNVRGSSGYGTAYVEMDDYKKRLDSVRDGVAAAQWLVDNGYAEPKRIAALGGSYGGFMVVATITQAPQLFGAACDIVGIVNFQTFLERTKDYRRALREVEYGPLTDPDFLKSISPIYLVDRIQTPLLIAHGRNDPRVPISEAEQLYEALKAKGQNPQLLVFDDEGHGFAKEPNRITFHLKLAAFFDEHLKP